MSCQKFLSIACSVAMSFASLASIISHKESVPPARNPYQIDSKQTCVFKNSSMTLSRIAPTVVGKEWNKVTWTCTWRLVLRGCTNAKNVDSSSKRICLDNIFRRSIRKRCYRCLSKKTMKWIIQQCQSNRECSLAGTIITSWEGRFHLDGKDSIWIHPFKLWAFQFKFKMVRVWKLIFNISNSTLWMLGKSFTTV